MIGKKLLGVMMCFNLAFSSFLFRPAAQVATNAPTNPIVGITSEEGNGTVDLALANEPKLIEMLKKTGKLAKNATPEQERLALANYLAPMQKNYNKNPGQLTPELQKQLDVTRKQLQAKGIAVKDPVTKEVTNFGDPWDGKVRSDKILVILLEFSDFKHNEMDNTEASFFFDDYNTVHYQNMVFGKDGYKAPGGETLMSMKQYYEEQSGGSYTVDGEVIGWHAAPKDAAYYGADKGSNHNVNAKQFVKDALIAAANSGKVNLNDYDQTDFFDVDGDGNLEEPDGIIDHLMVVHAGAGQEAGGGRLGDDAIWSHSSKVYDVVNGAAVPYAIPNTKSDKVDYWPGDAMAAFPYTIMPEDGAAGVFCHEYGHDMGLPDEYDTIYSGKGEPVQFWSMMSSGSWAGPYGGGTDLVSISPWGRYYYQNRYGGNWLHGKEIDLSEITTAGTQFTLDQAAIKGDNEDFVKITLPDRKHQIITPPSGQYAYFGGIGKDGDGGFEHNLTKTFNLTGKTSASISFKTWYDIELNWDYASVQVREVGTTDWVAVQGNLTTDTDPDENGQNPGHGITGSSNKQWVDANFDLTAYAGKNIELKINYFTDAYSYGLGFYVDDIVVKADNAVIFTDDAEAATSPFTVNGFTKEDGAEYSKHYYLIEWRNDKGSDKGLTTIGRGDGTIMRYEPGMVVWYADDFYGDNWVANHPGDGYLGVVDADQTPNFWVYDDPKVAPMVASTQYQIHDASFSLRKSQNMLLNFSALYGRSVYDTNTFMKPYFSDAKDYTAASYNPHGGKNLTQYGIKVYVTYESADRSVAKILIKK